MPNNGFSSIFKHQIKLAALIIICASIVVLGSSYALFFNVEGNTETQVVVAGNLSFQYSEDDLVSDDRCFQPMSLDDALLVDYDGVCSSILTIQNTGTLVADYNLYLVVNDDNEADLSSLKFILKNSTFERNVINGYPKSIAYGAGDETHVGTTLPFLTGSLNPGESITYYAQLYVDDSTNYVNSENKKVSINFRGATAGSDSNPIGEENDYFMVSFKEGYSYYSPTFIDKYAFEDGMTFGDWIKSDLYPGEVSGRYDSIQACENIWGSNKGCALSDYYYHVTTNYDYYSSLSRCLNAYSDGSEKCEPVPEPIYAVDEFGTYDSLEECMNYTGASTDECVYDNDNGKYKYLWNTYFYESYDDCINSISDGETCYITTDAYRYVDSTKYSYYTLEECEGDFDTCMVEQAYSPQFRNNTKDSFIKVINREDDTGYEFYEIDEDYVVIFSYEGYYYSAPLSHTIERKIYSTVHFCDIVRCAECVSPESDILSLNGKTIKAKNVKEDDYIAYYDFDTNKIEIGKVSKVYIHKDANSFIRYSLEDGSYLEATDYHPIYTKDGWKSYTNRNYYPKPVIGDMVLTDNGYMKIVNIETYNGKEDYYDFAIKTKDGKMVNNYYANGILVQGSY